MVRTPKITHRATRSSSRSRGNSVSSNSDETAFYVLQLNDKSFVAVDSNDCDKTKQSGLVKLIHDDEYLEAKIIATGNK